MTRPPLAAPALEGVEPPAPGDGRRAAARGSDAQDTILHASCAALPDAQGVWRATLIIGRSGAGKSSLALELMSRGAMLVADDRTRIRREGDQVIADCPPAIAGLIEARGIGLIRAPALDHAQIVLIVDLDAAERDRLPPPRHADLLGVSLPRILCGDAADAPGRGPTAHAATIVALLRGSGAPEPL
jgi:HPr kinase/phosphorylase